jgi:acyl-CoA synthetase (AMP-forming)/AMP-acid ligase II
MTNANIARHLTTMARERAAQLAVLRGTGRRDQRGKMTYEGLSFAELHHESDAYAWGLSAYGIGRGSRVLLMVPAGLPLISLTFALFKAGCVPILIDPAMGRRNLAQCIRECAPDALIGVERAQLARYLFSDAFRSVKKAVTVGRRLFWDGLTLEQLRADVATPFPIEVMDEDDAAAILFTTGSTGVPKGVLYEHGMFQAQLRMLRERFQVEPGEVDVPAFPLFALFNVGLGVTSAIPDLDPTRPAACDPAKIVEILQDQRATMSFGSPAIWQKVTSYCQRERIALPQLRRVLMAGAPVPHELHERFQSILTPPGDSYTPYGATEALPVTAISGRELIELVQQRPEPTAGTCVGYAVPGVTLRIIRISDAPIAQWNDTLLLPDGVVGEIVVSGAMVTKTYVNRPESTALAKIADGERIWHRMGDLGYLDAAGRLWFYGRKSHRVETTAGPLYTEPVEKVFNQHPRVYRSALVGVHERDGYKTPVVVIEAEPGQMPKKAAERERFVHELQAIGAHYPMTAAISRFMFHPSFPVDIRHNAKIFREQLADWAAK